MGHHRRQSLATIAAAVLLGAGPAGAQTVQMFDQPPPLELLRHIMVPESSGGLSRSIVIGRPAPTPAPTSVQRVSTQPMPMTPAAPVTQVNAPAPAAPVNVPVPAAPAPHPETQPADPVAAAGVVGFRINFAFDSDAIPAAYAGFVQRIGTLMQQEPQVKLRIEGHTDAVGTDAYNLDLSKRRALSVARYLVEKEGIAPERLAVAGKGKSEPVTANPYDAANRRVQFVRVE